MSGSTGLTPELESGFLISGFCEWVAYVRVYIFTHLRSFIKDNKEDEQVDIANQNNISWVC